MAIKIVNGPQPEPPEHTKHPQVQVGQMEVFGRLRLTQSQIAQYYGLTKSQIIGLMRRADLREAYDRGRTETVVAIRQTQLKLALGSTNDEGKQVVPPNPQMLIHAGYMFGDQTKDGIEPEPEDYTPSRFSWSTEMKRRLRDAREAILLSGTDE